MDIIKLASKGRLNKIVIKTLPFNRSLTKFGIYFMLIGYLLGSIMFLIIGPKIMALIYLIFGYSMVVFLMIPSYFALDYTCKNYLGKGRVK